MGGAELPGDRRAPGLRGEHRTRPPRPCPRTDARRPARRDVSIVAARLGRAGNMKEILDRHVERLTAAERETVARNILGSRVAEPRMRMRWVLAAAAAG